MLHSNVVKILFAFLFLGLLGGCIDNDADDPYLPPAEPPPAEPPQVTAPLDDYDIAFISDFEAPGIMELYGYSVTERSMTVLSAPLVADGNVTRFRFSPDGQYAAYIADQEVDETYGLYIVAADGTVTKVADSLEPNANFYWAPDSSAIAYLTEGVRQLNIASPDNSVTMSHTIEQIRQEDSSIGAGAIFLLRYKGVINPWSPDSSYLAFVVSYIVNDFSEGGTITTHQRLFASPVKNQTELNPVEVACPEPFRDTDTLPVVEYQWSPDSSLIACGAGDTEAFSFVASTPNGERTSSRFVQSYYSGITGPSFRWAPDSSRIISVYGPFAPVDDEVLSWMSVHTIGKDGGHLLFDVRNSDRLGTPSWSPDSSRIAVINEIEGSSTLYSAYPYQDAEPTALSDHCYPCSLSAGNYHTEATIKNGTAPAWSPDGKWIAYFDRDAKAVYVVDPDGIVTTRVSPPLSLLEGPDLGLGHSLNRAGISFDIWAPDSKRLLFFTWSSLYSTKVDGSGSDRIGLVYNGDPGLHAYAKWAPDSTLILYMSKPGSDFQLHLSTPDGMDQQKIADKIDPENFEWIP